MVQACELRSHGSDALVRPLVLSQLIGIVSAAGINPSNSTCRGGVQRRLDSRAAAAGGVDDAIHAAAIDILRDAGDVRWANSGYDSARVATRGTNCTNLYLHSSFVGGKDEQITGSVRFAGGRGVRLCSGGAV